MNWKLLAVALMTGMFVAFNLFWGGHGEGISVMAVDGPAIGLSGGGGPPPMAADVPGDGSISREGTTGGDPFASYPFYIAGHADRYAAYQLRMPGLDSEAVLWHVNAGLDSAPYASPLVAEGSMLLINKQHQLPAAYEPEELVVIHSSVTATPGTADAFRRMRAAAMGEGVYIEAAGGYRSLERQQELFEAQALYYGTEAAEEVVARPGFGEHSTGRALHIVDRNYTFDGFEELPEYAWLVENCAEYGFILRYGQDMEDITGFAYEPYHFTFVGRDTALDMKALGIATLEEYAGRGLAPPANTIIDDRTAVVIATGSGGGDHAVVDCIVQRIGEHLEEENIRVVVREVGGLDNGTKAAAVVGIERANPVQDIAVRLDAGGWESGSLAETVCSRLAWAGVSDGGYSLSGADKLVPTGLGTAPTVSIGIADTYDGLAVTEYSERMAKAIADGVVAHLGLRRMYLTFDDGPSPKYTAQVLDILKERDVKATFFVIGERAEKYPELMKRIVDEGHTIGIHCYTHDYDELYASVESFVDDFNKAQDAVREVTGLAPVIYRFPGGSINSHNKEVYKGIIAEMDKQGYVYYDWNITADDSFGKVEAGALLANVKEQQRPRNAVLLMHDAYPNIVAELEDIINYYAGYQMAVIDGETQPVHL